MAAELHQFIAELNLEQYFLPCLHAGILNWEAFIDITESEFTALNMRLGHRRKIQRAIARRKLWPDHRPLPSPAELRQHMQYLRRISRGVAPELLEESYYSLRSSTQSPWSQSTSCSNESDSRSLSTLEKNSMIRFYVADLLQSRDDFFHRVRANALTRHLETALADGNRSRSPQPTGFGIWTDKRYHDFSKDWVA
jgi:hypothetical protein